MFFQNQLKENYKKKKDQNAEAQRGCCETALKDLHEPVREKKSRGGYAVIGGYMAYQGEMKQIRENYKSGSDVPEYSMVSVVK